MTTPGSPSRRTPDKASVRRDRVLSELSLRWGINIQPPKDGESPSKRQEKLAVTSRLDAYAEETFFKINFLCLKDDSALSSALEGFPSAARSLHSGWIAKPNADEDLLPRSGNPNPSVTRHQREQLLECLLRFVTPAYEAAKECERKAIWSVSKPTSFSGNTTPIFARNAPNDTGVDDTPIPFRLAFKGKGKRRSDGEEELNEIPKRTRGLLGMSEIEKLNETIDSVPVTTREGGWPTPGYPIISRSAGPFVPSTSFSLPGRSSDAHENVGIGREKARGPGTVDTSFASNLSSVFDCEMSDASDETYFSTETSVMGVSFEKTWEEEDEAHTPMDCTQYGDSFEDYEIIDALRLSPEQMLGDRLHNIFPTLTVSLQSAPLPIRYEMTRICCYAGVPMTEFHIPFIEFSDLYDYDSLWRYLKNHPALKGKDFPQRSDPKAWSASLEKFGHGFHAVIMSAKLKFNNAQDGPFFKVQLQPLKLDLSHRLGRRFGNDRFIEISLPRLSGKKVPKILHGALRTDSGNSCRRVIVQWMIHGVHNFLGMTWGAFFIKDIKRRKTKIELSLSEELDNNAMLCIYFFATNGLGFKDSHNDTLPSTEETPQNRTRLSVSAMINWLIPLEYNGQEKSHKLFSRVALGLSKTWQTAVVEPSEIRYPPNWMSNDAKEVMNDGCGRLSSKMAMNISASLGLTYVPSGFQARIGGGKGFWIVDFDDLSDKQWIEIYPSQLKWVWPRRTITDVEHRTFEVLNWVKPLKSARLNLQFLPILEACGRTPTSMRDAISNLLVSGLTYEINMQRAAMESPQLFRKWIRENNRGLEDRLKNGRVPYIAGLPNSLEEQINMFLDAGFDPQRLEFLKNLAWTVYTQKCDILKRKLNITVGRSTFAYMAVDFTGTLEPDEVHLGFSTNFTDHTTGFSDTLLDGMDVLVARCPAHYVSDIQRVKAVWRRELKSLKDVIMFSSKGEYPLAKKLSGGDYDGDLAWVCFEPSLVREFINAEKPVVPNLIEQGFIKKDNNTYRDITEYTDPIPAFLEHSFVFNLQDNMLGICTAHKESLCYTTNDVRSNDAIFLSTLLSDLVDQYKQGYSFTPDDWQRVKNLINIKVRIPQYKSDKLDGHKAEHVIDYLKFEVAEQTVRKTLREFHNSLPLASNWDSDLAKLADWARRHDSPDWRQLLAALDMDIKVFKHEWSCRFSQKKKEKSPQTVAPFSTIVAQLHEQWCAISPPPENPLTDLLLPSYFPVSTTGTGISLWALLKASIAFSTGMKGSRSVWWMAGRQLAFLKAVAVGSVDDGGDGGGITVVTPRMYAMLRPDATFVKLVKAQERDPRWWEAKAESVAVGDSDEEGEELEW